MITVKTIASSSKGNAYLLDSGGRWLLLECGIPYSALKTALDFQVSRLDGCLLSHAHKDHSKCVYDLIRAGVDVYAHQETFEWCGVSWPDGFANPVKHKETVLINFHWTITPFDGKHDIDGILGFQISDGEDTLVFITDSGYCQYTFDKMTILMIEANFSEEILQRNLERGAIDKKRAHRVCANHMSIERVVEMLKANDLSRLREVRLLHLSDANSDEALFKRMIQEITGVPVVVDGA